MNSSNLNPQPGPLTIAHLYPEDMSLYGDRGNILTLMKRAKWHGLETKLVPIRPGEDFDFNTADILFMGGGQDRGQKKIARDLLGRKDNLKQAVENYLVTLLICGGYQLFGKYFKTASGEMIPGLSILDVWTIGSSSRQIGNIVVDIREMTRNWEAQGSTLVGFENHSGETFLGKEVTPLGTTGKGQGNNKNDGTEGAYYKNCFGTYLHGSLLPKNPVFADHLLYLAARRRYGLSQKLPRLDDRLEDLAHDKAVALATGRN